MREELRFDCERCRAPAVIVLPPDDRAEVICPSCDARQPRRDYELRRLGAQLARAATSAPAVTPSPPCPACGDELFVVDHGCERCGHGRSRSPALHAALLVLVFGAVTSLGVGAVWMVGTIGSAGPLLNVLAVTFGAGAITAGVHVLTSARPIRLAASEGEDAFGMQRWGGTRDAGSGEARRLGVVFLAVGLFLVALGVVVVS